jgi:hypothetical protein
MSRISSTVDTFLCSYLEFDPGLTNEGQEKLRSIYCVCLKKKQQKKKLPRN